MVRFYFAPYFHSSAVVRRRHPERRRIVNVTMTPRLFRHHHHQHHRVACHSNCRLPLSATNHYCIPDVNNVAKCLSTVAAECGPISKKSRQPQRLPPLLLTATPRHCTPTLCYLWPSTIYRKRNSFIPFWPQRNAELAGGNPARLSTELPLVANVSLL